MSSLLVPGDAIVTNADYDAIASWYDATVRSGSLAGDLVLPHLFDLGGDVRDRSICDLACGQGRVARALAQRGAIMVGVDLSAELIAIARRDETAEPLGITYLIDDAQQLALVDDAQFDGVVCNLALMDIPDLPATVHAVRRVLRAGGCFVFSTTHPSF